MVGLGEGEDPVLWRQWQAQSGAEALRPDALSMAAYAEGRLDETEAETVENWLAAHPEALSDVVAARVAMQQPPSIAHEAIVAKACALVAGIDEGAKVVPLRRTASGWRHALAWSSIAASLVAASLVGFAMGSDAYQSLSNAQISESTPPDTLAPSTPDFYFNDDSST
jgi:anti-sigma factor RsiW